MSDPQRSEPGFGPPRIGELVRDRALWRRGQIALQGTPSKATTRQGEHRDQRDEAASSHQNSRIVRVVITSRRDSQGDTVTFKPNAPLNVNRPRSADAPAPPAAR